MKNNKFLILTVLFFIFSTGIFVSTYALYRSYSVTNTSVETANFAINVNGTELSTTTNTFDIGSLNWTNSLGTATKNGKIAPGAYADLNIVVDATGSEVNVDYNITMNDLSGFTITSGTDLDPSYSPSTGTIAYATGANSMQVVVPVRIMWEGSSSDSATKNSTDIAMMNQTKTLEISVLANQHMN